MECKKDSMREFVRMGWGKFVAQAEVAVLYGLVTGFIHLFIHSLTRRMMVYAVIQ